MKLITLLPLAMLIVSCGNPLNLHTANKYFVGGHNYAAEGKWFNARMAFGRAWTNANLGKAEDRVTAVYAYEYGRASGAICDWTEAERGLLKALELDKKTQGPVHMSLVELARMYHASGALDKSESFFRQAKEALDEKQLDTRDAIGYATLLREYSDLLIKLDKLPEAEKLKRRALEIETVFKDRESGHEQTPYGKYCDQQSLS